MKRRTRSRVPLMLILFSSAPAAAPLLVHVELGELAVRAGHELLELILKAGRSLGLGGLRDIAAAGGGTAALRTVVSLGTGAVIVSVQYGYRGI